MAIYKDNKKVSAVYKGSTPISKVYDGNGRNLFSKQEEIVDYCIYETTKPNQEIKLCNKMYLYPIGSLESIYLVDEKESIEIVTSNIKYTFPNAGKHKVRIKFKNTVTNISELFSECTSLTTIPSGLFDNCTQATNFSSCFKGCSGLTLIPEGLFDNCTQVTDFSSCFNSCSGLTEIPIGLFDNCTQATNFSYCFQDCSGLTLIPEGLFDNCTQVTKFSSCFYNTSITSIPSGLFDNCTQVTDFSSCFSVCYSLTEIPEGLFDNCTQVTDFSSCFSIIIGNNDNNHIINIPRKLFAKNKKVKNFSNCFNQRKNITSPTPVDEDGTPIYNRSGEGKEGYEIPTDTDACFASCTKMQDYSSIPDSWK